MVWSKVSSVIWVITRERTMRKQVYREGAKVAKV